METQAHLLGAMGSKPKPSSQNWCESTRQGLKWEISTYMILIFSKPIAHHSYFQDQLELQSGRALFGLDYQITMQLLGKKADFRDTREAKQLCTSPTLEIAEHKLMFHMSINAFQWWWCQLQQCWDSARLFWIHYSWKPLNKKGAACVFIHTAVCL